MTGSFKFILYLVVNQDRVLIHAGSGGVGHFAIQIAKHLGAYVITTCSFKTRRFHYFYSISSFRRNIGSSQKIKHPRFIFDGRIEWRRYESAQRISGNGYYKTYTFEEIGKAHEHLESGRTIGKVVISVWVLGVGCWVFSLLPLLVSVSITAVYSKNAAIKLAPIAVVMLLEALAFWGVGTAFERKAGQVFLQGLNVSLQKK